MDKGAGVNKEVYDGKLNELMTVERKGAHAQKVQDVMMKNLSSPEKVKKITEIDQIYKSIESFEDELNSREMKRVLKQQKILTPGVAYDIFENIKKNKISRRFLFYLGDRTKLARFANETHLIKVGFFPFNTRIDKSIHEHLGSVKDSAKLILPILIAILKVAWAYIDKRDYNLLVHFKKMCEEILALDIDHLDFQRENILLPFEEIEKRFLVCHYFAEYPAIIKSSIERVFNHYPDWAEKLPAVENLLQNLINISKRKHSLYQILLAVNIVAYSRYFEVKDVVRLGYEDTVNNFNHDCGPEIQFKIKQFTDKRIDKLNTLTGEITEIGEIKEYMNQFLTRAEKGYDNRPLRMFYKEAGAAYKYNFGGDSKNVSLFAANFFSLFLRSFWNLFIGEVKLQNNKVQAFDKSLFEADFVSLRSDNTRFEKAFYAKHSFPYERFSALKKSPDASPSSMEREVITVIESMSSSVMNIGRKLAEAAVNCPKNGSSDDWKPLTAEDLANGKPIPFWSSVINDDSYMNKKTFGQAVSEIISICFLAGIYFYDREFFVILRREKLVDMKVNDIKVILERICDPVSYQKIIKSLPDSDENTA